MKHTPIDRRIRELEKELASVHGSIKTLARNPAKARAAAAASVATEDVVSTAVAEPPVQAKPPTNGNGARPDGAGADGNLRGRDERFVDYLASSLGPAQPLRRERNAERNRALVAIGFALLLLFWIVSRVMFP